MGFKVLEGLEDPKGVGEVTHWSVTAGSHHCLPGDSSERNSSAWQPVGPADTAGGIAPARDPWSHGGAALRPEDLHRGLSPPEPACCSWPGRHLGATRVENRVARRAPLWSHGDCCHKCPLTAYTPRGALGTSGVFSENGSKGTKDFLPSMWTQSVVSP